MSRLREFSSYRARLIATFALTLASAAMAGGVLASAPTADVRTFVTGWYPEGIPYAAAKAYGPAAVPELLDMLRDPAMEPHWTKIVWVLGCIGDSSATTPLIDFLQNQKGEVSTDAFRAALAVPTSLGHIARGGDAAALQALLDLVRSDAWQTRGLSFSYRRYQGAALGEVLGRVSIQGLGVSGTHDAFVKLNEMHRDKNLRADWKDNVDEAIQLNGRIRRDGADRAFGEVAR